jgi:hypothetical protein
MARNGAKRAIGSIVVIIAMVSVAFWINLMYEIEMLDLIILTSLVSSILILLINSPVPAGQR